MEGFIYATGSNQGLMMVIWIVALFGMMYFLFIRPQRKQMNERNQMIDNLKPDTRIMTVGGLTGVIRAVSEEYVYLELAEGLVVELSKQGVGQVLTEDDEGDDDEGLEEIEEVDEDDIIFEEEDVDDAGQQV